MKPYVDFYRANQISPVNQDTSDLHKHFGRRESLYRSLGIIPSLVQGRSVIEFGPGSGHNALYTMSLGPARYALVDANPTGLEQTARNIEKHFPALRNYELVESLINDYRSDERFDIVLCEGLLPFQADPAALTRHVAQFAKPGGVVVVTCMDSVSYLSEAIRRLMAFLKTDPNESVWQRLAILRPFFEPHLRSLQNMSRPVDDWILDAMIQPLLLPTLSMRRAIEILDDEFDAYGSSPEFITDWRWYKDIWGDQAAHNAVAVDAYWRNLANLLDYRSNPGQHPEAYGRDLWTNCDEALSLMWSVEQDGDKTRLPQICERLRALARACSSANAITADALLDAARFFESAVNGRPHALDAFSGFFGRGQQYLSLLRRSKAD